MTININKVRRGFEVFRKICINCHSCEIIKPTDITSIGYTIKQISSLLNRHKIDGYLKMPYKSLNQAKTNNNGIIPPDLSLMAKWKTSKWIYNVLTGYTKRCTKTNNNLYHNRYFDYGVTAMKPPLTNGCIKHNFSHPPTIHQYASDVSQFLLWISEPWINTKRVLNFMIIINMLIISLTIIYWNNLENI